MPLPSSSSQLSTPNLTTLQRLRNLDRSLPEFHDQLSNVLCGKAHKESVPNLQGDDLVLLVDYLDKVCRYISIPPSAQTSAGSRQSGPAKFRFPCMSTRA